MIQKIYLSENSWTMSGFLMIITVFFYNIPLDKTVSLRYFSFHLKHILLFFNSKSNNNRLNFK